MKTDTKNEVHFLFLYKSEPGGTTKETDIQIQQAIGRDTGKTEDCRY